MVIHGTADTRDDQIAALRAEVRDLRGQLANAQADVEDAKREAAHALSALRKQLSPLYRALQAVFGELDAAGVREDVSSSGGPAGIDSRVASVWAAWKEKLPGAPARIIDALLVHGDLNTTQLAIAAKMDKRTVNNAIYKMNTAGLINKNAGRFSLKPL